jgi:colicin import membrane protein
MDRLQKKCVVMSTSLHLLLAAVLFVGPAFVTSKQVPADPPVLDFIPSMLLDTDKSGGGNPNVNPAPPAPPAPKPEPLPPPPQPQPQPPAPEPPVQKEKAPEPEPVKESPKLKEDRPNEDSLEVSSKPKKPQVNLTLVEKKRDPKADAKARAEAQAREDAKAWDRTRQRLARQMDRAAQTLGNEMSGGTSVEIYGPGGGGPTYAGYDQFVRSTYWHAWVPPEQSSKENPVTRATVVIGSDGHVISSRIVRTSGDSGVDSSVQRALDRVTFIAPFPEGSKDKQKTYNINFDLNAKRLNG